MQKLEIFYHDFIGFDVAKDSITLYHSHTGQTVTLKNTPGDIQKYLNNIGPGCFAVCEATGGYEALLLNLLSKNNIPCHRADARKVKAFIRSLGIHGKSDPLDAKALSGYGQERHPFLPLWSMPDENMKILQALITRRQELVALGTAEKNRMQAPLNKQKSYRFIVSSCRKILKVIAAELQKIEQNIRQIITEDENLKKRQEVMLTIKGVGEKTAALLLAQMPELGSLSRRQAAALAGVAPHPRQSGKMNGYRRVSGGRQQIKKALFMAALVAARKNETLKIFYQRLLKNGKKPIVAITAIMRKIIVIINAKIRDLKRENIMS